MQTTKILPHLLTAVLFLASTGHAQQQTGAKPPLVALPAEEIQQLNSQLKEKQKWLWSNEPIDPAGPSNGCGPQWLMTLLRVLPAERQQRYRSLANVRTFSAWDSKTNTSIPFTVDFEPACDLHDAGYAGLFVLDRFGHGPNASVNFSSWTKERVDSKFLHDLRKICDTFIPNHEARDKCKGWDGARLYHELVSTVGYVSFDCNLNDGFLTRFRKIPPQFCTRKYTEDGWPLPSFLIGLW